METWIAEKLNQCEGKVKFIIPEGGFSALDIKDEPFYNHDNNQSLIQDFAATLIETENRQLIKSPHHVNSPDFCQQVINEYRQMMV
ncbi:Tm-1-like ATP-binding domain-containing protein [Photorhabdus kleinii]|uniref:Tm-1-like ATP-binding domain-containing protein n=1 Tax=Photorhabdus kleinii TaxID=768034 RepID=UPI00269DA955